MERTELHAARPREAFGRPMVKRLLTAMVAVFVCAVAAAEDEPGKVASSPSAIDVDRLCREVPIVDGNANYFSPSGLGQPDFRDVKRRTGIDFGSITLRSDAQFRAERRKIEGGVYKGVRLVLRRADIEAARAAGQYGVLFYAQNHPPLNGSIKPLARWHASGLRILQLAYGSRTNQSEGERLAGGSDESIGLTDLGRKVVLEMIRLGLVIDLSHCNERTVRETCKIARRHGVPVTANHTAAREIRFPDGRYRALHARNMSDRALQAIKGTGGVVGVMAYPPYLYSAAQSPGERVRAPVRQITVDDYVAHVDYIAKRIGCAHVGFATDGYLDGSHVRGRKADGVLDAPQRWVAVARKLAALGYAREDLVRLLGGNFLRVYRKVLR